MDNEEWVPVFDYEGLYEVSSMGRVRKLCGKSIAVSWSGNRGNRFRAATLRRNGKQKPKPVHALVMTSFVGRRPHKAHIAHLDGNRDNNTLSNLAYVTASENERHKLEHGTALIGSKNINAKLTDQSVSEMRILAREGMRLSRIAELYPVTRQSASDAIQGKTWRHVATPIHKGAGVAQ